MLIHKWRDSDINQMPEVGQLGKYSIPKGYVNATQMCHANNKSWGHYKERKSTKAYWTALSNDIGIPISSLVIEVDGYGSSQGTWIHPEIAIDLAQWVSVEFRIWANTTLMKVMLSTQVEPVQQQEPTHSLAPSHEAAQLAIMLGEFAGLDKSLTAQLAVNAATRVNPALKPAADELKIAIASLSLGGVRKFQIKPRNGKPTDFWLEHGSLLVMHPGCQSTHLHQVPKTNKVVSTRLTAIFR